MKYTKTQSNEIKDGFRIAWFIAIEMTLSGLTLGLAARIGFGGAVAIIWLPTFMALGVFSHIENKLSEPYFEAEVARLTELYSWDGMASVTATVDWFLKPKVYEEIVLDKMFGAINPYTYLKKFKLPMLTFILPKYQKTSAVINRGKSANTYTSFS